MERKGASAWQKPTGLWLASLKRLGLLTRLAEAAGANTASIRKAAKRLRV